jgi:hypothetical protein
MNHNAIIQINAHTDPRHDAENQSTAHIQCKMQHNSQNIMFRQEQNLGANHAAYTTEKRILHDIGNTTSHQKHMLNMGH